MLILCLCLLLLISWSFGLSLAIWFPIWILNGVCSLFSATICSNTFEIFLKNPYLQPDEMAQREERAHFWPFHTFQEIKTVISWGKLHVWQLRKEKKLIFLRNILTVQKISWLNLENHYIQFKRRLQSSLLFKVSSLKIYKIFKEKSKKDYYYITISIFLKKILFCILQTLLFSSSIQWKNNDHHGTPT